MPDGAFAIKRVPSGRGFFRPPNGLFSCPDCDRGFFALETLRRGLFRALETHYSFVSDPAGPLGGGGLGGLPVATRTIRATTTK